MSKEVTAKEALQMVKDYLKEQLKDCEKFQKDAGHKVITDNYKKTGAYVDGLIDGLK